MIDFRYHLVSLISVFLALAVGIVLGAGPLRDTVSDTLTGEVQDLREDRERLRADLEAAELNVIERNDYIEAAAPVLLADLMPEHTVALVTLPGTDPADVEMIRARLGEAGAEVVTEVAVTEAWADPSNRSFRQTFAGQLLGYLSPAPPADADTATIFGAALAQALTGAEGEEGDADTLYDLLVSAEEPLVSGDRGELADSTLLVGPRPAVPAEETPDPEDAEAAEETRAAFVALAESLAAQGGVTVGSGLEGELVAAIRADDDAAGVVTTVDSVGEVPASVSVPLALAVVGSGGHGQYGSEAGAEAPMPPYRPLTPPEEPAAEAPAPEGGEAPADGEPAAEEATP